jgi:hypothetical protein
MTLGRLYGDILDTWRRVHLQLSFSSSKKVFNGREILLFDFRVFPELHPDKGMEVWTVCLNILGIAKTAGELLI